MSPLIIFAVSAVLFLILVEGYIVFRRKKKFSLRDLSLVLLEWDSIRSKSGRDPKHALIEADRLLDYVLKKRGYTGSLGEKMKKAEKVFSRKDDIWNAHRLRNRAVHEMGFDITVHEAQKALSSFKQALWDLGIKFR
ncbi:MAG: hypothetical protein AAB588_03825 [Patescibacteria group bacterium]